jgi:hypothetical protein
MSRCDEILSRRTLFGGAAIAVAAGISASAVAQVPPPPAVAPAPGDAGGLKMAMRKLWDDHIV